MRLYLDKDQVQQAEPETPAEQAQLATAPMAHSGLCKYFFWAGAFLKQDSEPIASLAAGISSLIATPH